MSVKSFIKKFIDKKADELADYNQDRENTHRVEFVDGKLKITKLVKT